MIVLLARLEYKRTSAKESNSVLGIQPDKVYSCVCHTVLHRVITNGKSELELHILRNVVWQILCMISE